MLQTPVPALDAHTGTTPGIARNWCFFLDVDGTLLDIAAHPTLVRVDAALLDLLQKLTALTASAVALVSGRSIADLDRLFPSIRLPAAGQHGLERRDAGGDLIVAAHAAQCDALPLAAPALERVVAQYPALTLERKGLTLAMHYRHAPDLAPVVAAAMRDALDTLGDGFELLQGKMVIELKPRAKNKGTAIAEFMQEPPFTTRVPVYIGDDTTDECAFAQVNHLAGHTLKVGTGPSCARWRLADVAAVRAWLHAVVEQYAAAPQPQA